MRKFSDSQDHCCAVRDMSLVLIMDDLIQVLGCHTGHEGNDGELNLKEGDTSCERADGLISELCGSEAQARSVERSVER